MPEFCASSRVINLNRPTERPTERPGRRSIGRQSIGRQAAARGEVKAVESGRTDDSGDDDDDDLGQFTTRRPRGYLNGLPRTGGGARGGVEAINKSNRRRRRHHHQKTIGKFELKAKTHLRFEASRRSGGRQNAWTCDAAAAIEPNKNNLR